MGLLEDLREPPRRYVMRVDEILAELSPEDRKAADEALHDAMVSDGRISRALTRNGHSVAESSVRAWRRRHVPRG